MPTPSSPSPLTRLEVIGGVALRALAAGIGLGGIGGAIFGTLVVPFIGTLVGFITGVLVGCAVGIGNAIALSLLTTVFFYPLSDRAGYAYSVRFISVYLTLVISLIGFAVFRSSNDRLFVAHILQPDWQVHIPALIACVSALYASRSIIRWYCSVAPATPYDQQRSKHQRYALLALCVTLLLLPIAWVMYQWPTIYVRIQPGQEVIVYVKDDNRYGEYLMYATPDGSVQRRLTHHFDVSVLNNTRWALQPGLAPQGEGVVYISNHEGSDLKVYQLRLDGSPAQRIDTWPRDNRGAVLSPDGQNIVHPWGIAADYGPRPDSVAAGTQEPEAVEVRTRDGSTKWCITCRLAPGHGRDFAWSPDGQRIAFSYGTGSQYHLFVASWDGSSITQMTQDQAGEDFEPAWSPDGEWIAFTRRHEGQGNIMVMRSDGTALGQLTMSGAESEPAWSPDGTQIAFSSRRDQAQGQTAQQTARNASNIYVMQRDGSGQHPITFGDNSYADPVWVRAPSP